jgi:hypothetical protein
VVLAAVANKCSTRCASHQLCLYRPAQLGVAALSP